MLVTDTVLKTFWYYKTELDSHYTSECILKSSAREKIQMYLDFIDFFLSVFI